MIIITVEQNSPEWFKEKHGVLSSSRVSNTISEKVMNKTEIINMLKDNKKAELDKKLNGEDYTEKEMKKEIAAYNKEIALLTQTQLEDTVPRDIYQKSYYKTRKKEYWRLMAEKLGYFDDELEDPRDRGHRLEDEAAEKLEEAYNIKTLVIGFCKREDYPDIGLSPDRLIADEEDIIKIGDDILGSTKFRGGVEIKSPGVVNHLKTIFCEEVPAEYWEQVIQYFVVAEVEYVYFVSYNPLVKARPLYVIKINRKDVEDQIKSQFEAEKSIVDHIKEDILSLTF